MKVCPTCQEQNTDGASICSVCSQPMNKKCPFCAEEIHPQAHRCKHCKTDLNTDPTKSTPGPVVSSMPEPGAPVVMNDLPIGEDRNVFLVFFLGLITCGIYAIVHWFMIAGEINRHSGRERLNPGLDLLLAIVTCGIWTLVMAYKYPRAMYEMQLEEGIQATDSSTICLIIAILGLGFVPFLLVQNELNEHWKRYHGGSV